MSRLFAIGDIHAHYNEYMDLESQLLADGMDPWRDTVVVLGDMVDGGPDAKKLLDALIQRSQDYPHWVFLRGNHSQMMLNALKAGKNDLNVWHHWWSQGGRRTAYSYLPTEATDYERAIMQHENYIDPKHIEWLQSLPFKYEHPNYYFVHAGFRPGVPIEQQSEEDMLWIRESFFTQRYNFGRPIIFGHTPVADPMVVYDYRKEHRGEIVAIGIDTMVGDFGKLTAVELDPKNPRTEPRFFFQPAEKGPFEDFDGFR